MAIPSPEELQYILGIHPDQMLNPQSGVTVDENGNQVPMRPQPGQATPAGQDNSPRVPLLRTGPAPRGLDVPKVGETEKPPENTLSLEEHLKTAPGPSNTSMLAPDQQAMGAGATETGAGGRSISDLMTKPINPLQADEERHRTELNRLETTGSGLSQFSKRHKVWGGLLRGLDIAGQVLAPGVEEAIPGTEGHHRELIGEERGALNQDLNTEEKQARVDALRNPQGKPNAAQPEFDKAGNIIGFRTTTGDLLGPKSPKLTQDMKDMIDAAEQRTSKPTTPEGQVMAYYVANGKTAAEAYKLIQDAKNDNKPDTGVEYRKQFDALIQKAAAAADGSFDPKTLTDIAGLGKFIQNSKGLTPQEKNQALGYLATNGTPAAQGTAAKERGKSYESARPVQVLDTWNGNRPIVVSMEDINNAPAGRYLAATGGTAALNKTNLMEDIKGALENTRQAVGNLKSDFPNDMRFKLTLALKSRDPESALSALLASSAINNLTPEQQDYLVAVNQLVENAMAMRSMLGAGQGSDDVRRAIANTIPGAITGSKDVANKQLDAFEAQLNRLTRGIPEVPLRKMPGEGGTGGNSGTVLMRAPDGTTKPVPADQVEHYKSLGAKVVKKAVKK